MRTSTAPGASRVSRLLHSAQPREGPRGAYGAPGNRFRELPPASGVSGGPYGGSFLGRLVALRGTLGIPWATLGLGPCMCTIVSIACIR